MSDAVSLTMGNSRKRPGKGRHAPRASHRAVGRDRQLRHFRLQRQQHSERRPERPVADPERRENSGRILQRHDRLPSLRALSSARDRDAGRPPALHQSRQRLVLS